ncbi:MAG: hypothetical protein IKS96_12340, partial [Fibrobacter sp.]|nr:hypothetical protein [Fibrobacter sp.]
KGEIGNPTQTACGKGSRKTERFAGFIKCLVKWLPERTGSLFLWHKRTFPLPKTGDLPILFTMKMISAIRFNRWWWGSTK